ncbi:MAG: chromophore lyase CpcT/CpeT [Gammaproteobacteria bacterium]|nr:chromophore lyase CpcT/CpeT [Gammaproteobacteria bacterium]
MTRSLIAALLLAAASIQAAPETDPFARDLLILTGWFEGGFDNEEQRWFQADPRSNMPEDQRHVRVHAAHKRIEAPDFGEHVFYVEEYTHDDPERVYRQRLVIFSSAPDEGGIRMQQGFFHEPGRFLGAQNQPGLLKDLKPSDAFFLDQCDVYFKRVAGQFEGGMRPKACVFGEGELRRYSVHNLRLSANQYWRVDSTFLVADDTLHVGMPADRPFELRRAKRFNCGITFDPRGPEPQEISDISLHSQGGSAEVTRQRDGQPFMLLMRDKEYPYYSTRPDFIYFSIRRKGEQASVVFTVNDPDSRSLGVNTGELLAYCHREGYEFRESLEALANSGGQR